MKRPTLRRLLLALFTVAWLGAIGYGVHAASRYATRPGAQRDAPTQWPTASTLVRASWEPTLVIFLHPECACTRASLTELSHVIHDAPGGKYVVVIVGNSPDHDLWDTVGQFAAVNGHVERVLDHDGREAHRFGAETSGHVVVYDAAGLLRFQGGITAARGHAGDNMGRRMAVTAMLDARARFDSHAVFGCGLEEGQ